MNNIFKVEGELVVKDGTGSMIEFYEEDFILDSSITKEQGRALIRKGLITDKLRRSKEGFKRVRTCQVVDIAPTKEKAESSKLSKAMIKAVDMGCVPANIDSYKNTEDKIKAVDRAIETQKKRNKAKKPEKYPVKDLGVVDD